MTKAQTLLAIRQEQALSRSLGKLKTGKSALASIAKGLPGKPPKRDRPKRPHWTMRGSHVPATYVSRLTGR